MYMRLGVWRIGGIFSEQQVTTKGGYGKGFYGISSESNILSYPFSIGLNKS